MYTKLGIKLVYEIADIAGRIVTGYKIGSRERGFNIYRLYPKKAYLYAVIWVCIRYILIIQPVSSAS